MPAKIYYDADADLGLLKGRKIAIIGYGSQGHAHALNLKDSGQEVVVGLYKGSKSWAKAEKDGLRVATVNEAAQMASVIMILLPDQSQRQVFESEIKGGLGRGKMLMFAHGFNIHFNQVVPPPDVDVTMIAPKAPGHVMRDLFTQGPGVPALLAVYQDVSGRARDAALAYGKGVGCTRAGVIETTFKEETETDLFGEQTTLCGGISHLIKAAFETLVEAGYQPEVAYFECMHEMKLIVDLFYQGGLAYMRYSVSDTAEYGDYTRGPRIVSDETKAEMKKILGEIQSGQFAREWVLENQANRAGFLAMRRRDADHQIEEAVDPFVGPSTRVSIFLSPLDVHVNRAPIGGLVVDVVYTPGRFVAAYDPDAGDNERCAVRLQGDAARVTVVQIAGVVARRIVCRVGPGDKLAAGERFGMIRFGSRTDCCLPRGAEVRVRVGDRVTGGVTVLGLLS